jgi:hypothetical protein
MDVSNYLGERSADGLSSSPLDMANDTLSRLISLIIARSSRRLQCLELIE